jgi:hypothetical protein
MAYSFQTLNPADSPDVGRVKINTNFGLINVGAGGVGSSIWTAGTGAYSIKAVNGTKVYAVGDYSIAAGYYNNAKGNYSTILNGVYNVANSKFGFISSGYKNQLSIASNYSTIINGYKNIVSGVHSIILNGKQNTINGSYSSIIGSTGTTISPGQRMSVININNISSTVSNRVYVPDLQITNSDGASRTLYIQTASTNSTCGTIYLTSGTATILTTQVQASSMIFLTPQTPQTPTETAANIQISARTAGVSFVISSTTPADSRLVAWWIVQQV